MKKLMNIAIASILAISLFACASMQGNGTSKVKCPKCGHEFTWSEEG